MSLRDKFRRATAEEKAEKRAAYINKPGVRGAGSLFRAVEKNNMKLVAKLISEGAEVDGRTQAQGIVSNMVFSVPYASGSTPLHAAALLGHDDIARYLLEKGADANAKNYEGHTPLDYALISHTWHEENLEKKKESTFTLQRYVDKAAEKVKSYNQTIRTILSKNGRTGLFKLPEKFAQFKPGKKPSPDQKPKF